MLARRLWLAGQLTQLYEIVADAQRGLSRDDRELSLMLEAIALNASSHDARRREFMRERLAVLAAVEGATPGERAVLASLAFELVKTCQPVEQAMALVDRALVGASGYAGVPDTLTPLLLVAVLHWSSQIGRAVALADTLIDEARSIGSVMLFAEISTARALVRWRGGLLHEAEADARQALAAVGSSSGQMHGIATHVLIGTLTDRGELIAAQAVAEQFQPPGARSSNPMWPVVACTHGQLEACLGRYEEALARLTRAGSVIEATGCEHPAGGEWRQPAAQALAALGRLDEAREMLAPAMVAARRSGGPYELGITLRAAALIEQPVRVELLREALAVLEPSEICLQHARVLVDLGAALRREGHRREAREPLAEAAEIAYRCGAAPLVDRARTELLAAGARPRRIERTGADALTPSELRVARLAREGLSNREIAQQLFVSPHTIRAQLRSAYLKLSIGSREELPAALTADKK
jgi:ATP/maltotriose-dependent transcriptional regulator MalT